MKNYLCLALLSLSATQAGGMELNSHEPTTTSSTTVTSSDNTTPLSNNSGIKGFVEILSIPELQLHLLSYLLESEWSDRGIKSVVQLFRAHPQFLKLFKDKNELTLNFLSNLYTLSYYNDFCFQKALVKIAPHLSPENITLFQNNLTSCQKLRELFQKCAKKEDWKEAEITDTSLTKYILQYYRNDYYHNGTLKKILFTHALELNAPEEIINFFIKSGVLHQKRHENSPCPFFIVFRKFIETKKHLENDTLTEDDKKVFALRLSYVEKIIDILIQAGASLEESFRTSYSSKTFSPFQLALDNEFSLTEDNNKEVIRYLLKKGLQLTSSTSCTVISESIHEGTLSPDMITFLIDLSDDVDTFLYTFIDKTHLYTLDGITKLVNEDEVEKGLPFLSLLLEKVKNINALHEEKTVLDNAIKKNTCTKVIDLLLSKGATGNSLTHLLIDYQKLVDKYDGEWNIPIHEVQNLFTQAHKVLLENPLVYSLSINDSFKGDSLISFAIKCLTLSESQDFLKTLALFQQKSFMSVLPSQIPNVSILHMLIFWLESNPLYCPDVSRCSRICSFITFLAQEGVIANLVNGLNETALDLAERKELEDLKRDPAERRGLHELAQHMREVFKKQ